MALQSPTRYASRDQFVFAATVLVVLGVLAIGIWSAGVSGGDRTPIVGDDASDRYASIDAINATRTTVIERNGTVESTTVYDATLVPDSSDRRLALVDSSTDRYDLRISNESFLFLHERDSATVTRIPLSGPSATADTDERIGRLLVRSGLTAGDAGSSAPAVEPLPVVPRKHTPSVRGPDAGYDVSYVGTERIDERETYVVRISRRTNGTDTYRQTLWLDTERFYPLQRQTTWRDDGTRTELTTTYTNVTFDPVVPDGTFRPEIGPDTTVETTEAPETHVYRGLAALRANTSIAVPNPDIPPSYELAYATRTEGSVNGVGLQYVNRTSRLTVSMYNFTYETSDPDARVEVDGRSATVTNGRTTSVSWNCAAYRYTVRGDGVPTEQIVAVGRSIGCGS